MEDKIKCLVCGKKFVRPLSHVWQKHGISAREYKEEFGLDVKKGIATEEYKQTMRQYVFDNKTFLNLKKGRAYWFKKGQKGLGKYHRSGQTMARLKEHWNKFGKLGRLGGKKVEKVEIKCAVCGKPKMIYPRYKQDRNYCGVVCRNIGINNKRYNL